MEATDTIKDKGEFFTGYEDTVTVVILMHLPTAFDSIKPCDSTYLFKGDTRTVAEFMPPPSVSEASASQPDINPFLIAFAFTILAYSTAAYISNCVCEKFAKWHNLFKEIATILR
jgi:hypothetical protein